MATQSNITSTAKHQHQPSLFQHKPLMLQAKPWQPKQCMVEYQRRKMNNLGVTKYSAFKLLFKAILHCIYQIHFFLSIIWYNCQHHQLQAQYSKERPCRSSITSSDLILLEVKTASNPANIFT